MENGGIGDRARQRECAQSGFADHFRLNVGLDASKCAGDGDFLSRTQCDDESEVVGVRALAFEVESSVHAGDRRSSRTVTHGHGHLLELARVRVGSLAIMRLVFQSTGCPLLGHRLLGTNQKNGDTSRGLSRTTWMGNKA